jgi:hypothetical protein
MRRHLAGRVIERKLRLSRVWRELSPPRAISLDTLRELAPPGTVLLDLRPDDGALLGTIDPGRARICVHGGGLSHGNI